MTRRWEAGAARGASTPRAFITRRHCYPTARCWSQGDLRLILPARNFTTPRAGAGRLRVPPHRTLSAHGNVAIQRQVLVVGGSSDNSVILSSAELYDPTSGSWTVTGSLNTARDFHTATLLPNGKVLVVGGHIFRGGALASAELYDPASGSWTVTGSLNTPHEEHTATLLPNGKVLVAAGSGYKDNVVSSAELYDPRAGSGRLPVASTPRARGTGRRCCPTARCWW